MKNLRIAALALFLAPILAGAVVGGEPVDADATIASSVTALHNGKSVCTTSVLSSRVLLTAAHCVKGHPLEKIRVAPALDMFTMKPENIQAVERIEFLPGEAAADVAIVFLKADLPATYRPVALAGREEIDPRGFVLAGYGYVTPLTHKGAGILRSVEMLVSEVKPGEVIFDQRKGAGGCRGDSGAPIYHLDGDTVVQAAMMTGQVAGTFTEEKDECAAFSYGTRVRPHLEWIRAQVPAVRIAE